MNEKTAPTNELSALSRRDLIGTGLALATVGCSPAATRTTNTAEAIASAPTAPFDSLRDYVAALEARGLVVRIPRVNQDEYEAAALMYRIRDQHGMRGGPALIFEEIRIDGKWVKGPLIVNESGNLFSECLVFGLEPVDDSPLIEESYDSYRKARAHVEQMVAANGGKYPTIPPVEVTAKDSPCKEIVLTGDDIDLTKFQFIKCNPGDVGRYINTGIVFTRDPEQGVNIGTYRCHLRGPREIGLNSERNQTGNRHLTAARDRGETMAKVSIALSADPYCWMCSTSKMADRSEGPVDELALAGGLAGRPVKVVKSHTNDFMVPANAEIIIEGEVPLNDLRPEGPYGEMVGYQGPRKEQQYWMRVTAVTHRKDPWVMNNFTGLSAGALQAASHARPFYQLKQQIPAIVDLYSDTRAQGVTFASIRKTRPGQGLEIAKQLAKIRFNAKIIIVVDDDLDVTNHEQMLGALGARWQPYGTTHTFKEMRGLPTDPSIADKFRDASGHGGLTSKIAIDATRQWAEEGGREKFPPWNRTVLQQGAPNAFARVDEQWGEFVRNWRPG